MRFSAARRLRLLTFLGRRGFRRRRGFGGQVGGQAAATIAMVCLLVNGCQHPSASRPHGLTASQGSADERIRFYQKKLGGPGTYPSYARLGMAYAHKARETGNNDYYKEAEKCFLQSLKFQRNHEALAGMAIALSAQHKFAESLPYAEEGVRAMPRDVDGQGILFDIQLGLGDVEKAEQTVMRMVRELPGFASYTRLTALRAYQGDLAGAIESMGRAVMDAQAKKLPTATRAWAEVRLGALLVEQCQAEQGRAAYGRALDLLPDYYFALEHIAELEAAEGRAGKAIEVYEKLLRKVPDSNYRVALAELYDGIGQAEKARQQRDLAAKDWAKSVASGAQTDFRPFAMLMLDAGKPAEALKLAEKDWKVRQDTFAADTLAYAYFLNGNVAEAKRYMDQALRFGCANTGILLHAAEIYLSAGEVERARELLDRAGKCPRVIGPGDKVALARLAAVFRKS